MVLAGKIGWDRTGNSPPCPEGKMNSFRHVFNMYGSILINCSSCSVREGPTTSTIWKCVKNFQPFSNSPSPAEAALVHAMLSTCEPGRRKGGRSWQNKIQNEGPFGTCFPVVHRVMYTKNTVFTTLLAKEGLIFWQVSYAVGNLERGEEKLTLNKLAEMTTYGE